MSILVQIDHEPKYEPCLLQFSLNNGEYRLTRPIATDDEYRAIMKTLDLEYRLCSSYGKQAVYEFTELVRDAYQTAVLELETGERS